MADRARVRFLATDIWDAPDDGKIYEVIEGELFMSPPPLWWHQRGLGKLYLFVGTHVYSHHLGEVVTAPIGVVLDEENGLEPDLVYVSRERAHIISRRGVEGAPDLVVEVLSPGTQARDRGIKMRRYAASGVPHYWIVDPVAQTLEAYRLGPTGYELTGTYGPGAIFRPELFSGLEIPIDALWSY